MSIAALSTGSRIIHQHLHEMEGAGLVRSARQGCDSLWQLERANFDQARHYLGAISSQWDRSPGPAAQAGGELVNPYRGCG
jgi:hypothetical protein